MAARALIWRAFRAEPDPYHPRLHAAPGSLPISRCARLHFSMERAERELFPSLQIIALETSLNFSNFQILSLPDTWKNFGRKFYWSESRETTLRNLG